MTMLFKLKLFVFINENNKDDGAKLIRATNTLLHNDLFSARDKKKAWMMK